MTIRHKGGQYRLISGSNRLTTMKTLTMYLRAAKTEAEEAGISTDGMADSVSKLRDSVMELTGVDIMLDED